MISIEIANMEMFLGQNLAALLHIEEHLGEIIYLTPKSNIGRLEILENVMQDVLTEDTKGTKHLGSIIGRAKAVITKRHNHIHNAWAVSQEEPEKVHRLPLPIREKTASVPVELTELETLIQDIRQLCEDIRVSTLGLRTSWEKKVLATLSQPPKASKDQ